MKKKLLNLAVIVIGIGLIISLSGDILRLLKAGDRIKQAESKLEEVEKEHQELAELKEYYQSDEFVEKQARDKLNLSKEGETVVVLPENVEELVSLEESQEPQKTPNWQQWLKLFF